MRVNLEDIQYCIDAARQTAGRYCEHMYPLLGFPRSTDGLRWVASQDHTISYTVLKQAAPRNSVFGQYEKLPDGFRITLQPGMNVCWTRFVLCKEIFHVLLDQLKYRIAKIEKHISDIEEAFPIVESQPGPTVVSEVLAEIAAVEFLFPYQERKVRIANTDYLAIAHEFKIPQVMVEKYMSASYMSNLGVLAR